MVHGVSATQKELSQDLNSGDDTSTWLSRMTATALIWRYVPLVAATGISVFTLDSEGLHTKKALILLLSQIVLAVAGVYGLAVKASKKN